MSLADGASAADVAKAVSTGLAKAAVAARINGTVRDLATPVSEGDTVEIFTFDAAEGKSVFWHSSSHILAQAVQKLFPSAKIAIGPAIESGFYYDFDVDRPFTPEDLAKIEAECRAIIAAKLPVVRREVSPKEAQEYFREHEEPYKLELLEQVEGNPSMYVQGEWRDLCRGPHVPNTGMVKALKLLNSAGAYWRGDERNKMLQRIYGISFPKQSMLEE